MTGSEMLLGAGGLTGLGAGARLLGESSGDGRGRTTEAAGEFAGLLAAACAALGTGVEPVNAASTQPSAGTGGAEGLGAAVAAQSQAGQTSAGPPTDSGLAPAKASPQGPGAATVSPEAVETRSTPPEGEPDGLRGASPASRAERMVGPPAAVAANAAPKPSVAGAAPEPAADLAAPHREGQAAMLATAQGEREQTPPVAIRLENGLHPAPEAVRMDGARGADGPAPNPSGPVPPDSEPERERGTAVKTLPDSPMAAGKDMEAESGPKRGGGPGDGPPQTAQGVTEETASGLPQDDKTAREAVSQPKAPVEQPGAPKAAAREGGPTPHAATAEATDGVTGSQAPRVTGEGQKGRTPQSDQTDMPPASKNEVAERDPSLGKTAENVQDRGDRGAHGRVDQGLTESVARHEGDVSARHSTEETSRPQARAEIRELPHFIRRAELVARAGGPTEMRVQLVPENLGRLSVRVSVGENGVTARLIVENAEVKALVEDRLPELERALRDQGLRLNGLSVGCEDTGGRSGSHLREQVPAPFERGLSYGAARRGYDEAPALAAANVSATASRLWTGSGGLFDALA